MTGKLRLRLDKWLEGDTLEHGVVANVYAVPSGLDPVDPSRDRRDVVIPAGGPEARILDVEPGRYLIEALLPSGETVSREIAVAESDDLEVFLRGGDSPHEWLSWQHLVGNVRERPEVTDVPEPEAVQADVMPVAGKPPYRFSRMGPRATGRQLGERTRLKVAEAMVADGDTTSRIPAGFTYLGQFISNDLTFDTTSVMLDVHVSPVRMLEAHSPSLDLRSLYGAGPDDPASAPFYADDGLHLKLGSTAATGQMPALEGFDLPRGEGTTPEARRRAIIPDPRNDENLAVAQTHLAFTRFHNRVVDTLPAALPPAQRFARAREVVTKHYQWMIRSDYLRRICAAGVVSSVFRRGRRAFEVGVAPTDIPTLPIEFSVAAFRLGHSMIRSAYHWNEAFDSDLATLDLLFTYSGSSGTFAGSEKLPSNWTADFRRLYDFKEVGRVDLGVVESKFNRAMRIDTRLVSPLATLPGFPVDQANLAFRNLTRANIVKLATGQQMATFLKYQGVPLTRLTRTQILDGNAGADLSALTKSERSAFATNTPLWFYLLREAEFNRGRLFGVGAQIVAETIHRAIEGSHASIVRDPDWRPTLGPDDQTFRMVDLLIFAFEGQKSLLAPLADPSQQRTA